MKKIFGLFQGFIVLITIYCHAHNEGFWPDTLVHSPSGIHQIQEYTVADTLFGYNREIKQITSTMKVLVDCSIRITLADAAIRVGCAQKLCTDHVIWVEAQDLQPGDVLLDISGNHHVVLGLEIIHEPALLYALSVENNVLCIEPYGLLVHNAAAALCGLSSISLGVISIVNPVTIAVGATLALSLIAKQALQIKQDQDASNDAHSATSNTWAERSYYETRKKELEQIKTELIRIKKAIGAIKTLCNTASFTYQFFKKIEPKISMLPHPWLAITKDKEQRLTKAQQEELRALRQHDVLLREHEIIELQVMLAMHSNELISHIDADCAEYQSRVGALPDSFHDFQCGYLADKEIAALYACLLTQELMLDRSMRLVQEACCVAEYYHKLPSSSCIGQSTTIVDAWKNAKPCITAKNQWIAQERKTCTQRMQTVEQYFTRRGGNIAKLKQGLRITIENNLHKRENNIFSAILNKRDTVTEEATASATLPEQGSETQETKTTKTVEKLIADSKPWTEKDFCKQYIKEGGYQEALNDFYSLGLTVIRNMKGKNGKIGILSDGRTVVVREESTAGPPTLEIQKREGVFEKSIKFRYGQPKY